mmetsp:Transcript_16826/g.35399  ORF Transcript_16826/g.35399 Transcript_16826/m.35399 type:complete len:104 (-) Transcript_16826:21-332(-)
MGLMNKAITRPEMIPLIASEIICFIEQFCDDFVMMEETVGRAERAARAGKAFGVSSILGASTSTSGLGPFDDFFRRLVMMALIVDLQRAGILLQMGNGDDYCY